MASSSALHAAFDVEATVSFAAALTEDPRIRYQKGKMRQVSRNIAVGLRGAMLEVLAKYLTSGRRIDDVREMALEQASLLPAGIDETLIAWAKMDFSTAEEAWPLVSK